MKKNYVSPCILLQAGGDPGGDDKPWSPADDELGKQGELGDFDDFDKEKFSQW
ncbi:hypothetical protein [Prevotella corporis]|uniref:hypothetical protein n=1 Tax=Prevotella corporis TaxID=28128 RepID=UPI0023F45700|nr:hypothetical protein [Prevotella corporis]